ncbi:RDD family protein [Mycolicibacterium sp.]|uniref:RDD family protein n=1 Tax=Mycolicibacterium sp. TaxID=2320850 RepID=UPI0037C6C1C9
MTSLNGAGSQPAGAESIHVRLASWKLRAVAIGMDYLPGLALVLIAVVVALSVPAYGGWWWTSTAVGSAAVMSIAINRLVLAAFGGHSLGRAIAGITIVRPTGEPISAWRLFIRELAHALDTATCFVGWLLPLWDRRGRTIADLLANTESHMMPSRWSDRVVRRLATFLVLSVGLLCGFGAAFSYFVVHQHDRAVRDTRTQLAEQGPHIVEKVLSYDPSTLGTDFQKARALVTDNYRSHLVEQQDGVVKSPAVRNEYWATNSSVLTATADRATMLVFLQGQRGAAPNQRYITATVRAAFVKTNGSEWRLDDLAVVTKPQTAAVGP